MLTPRIIPCLLVRRRGLVKTIKFTDAKYVGDPVNAVKIFNEKRADELTLIDIGATRDGTEPDYQMIKNVAAECRMPLCYGGGIHSVQQATQIFGLGVEKIALSSAAIQNPSLLRGIASEVGNQSLVGVLDVRKKLWRGYEVLTHNGTKNSRQDLLELIDSFQENGVGEIVINSIDRDGTMTGYDLDLLRQVVGRVSVPLTVLGGAGSYDHFRSLFREFGILGAAAGSLFVFKGKFRAVLISYPGGEEKQTFFQP